MQSNDQRIQRLPKCSCCGKPILSKYGYRMQIAELLCQKCFDEWTAEIREEIA